MTPLRSASTDPGTAGTRPLSTDTRPGPVHAGGRTRQAPPVLLGRREAAAWHGIPPRRLAGACGPFEGGCTARTLRGEVRRVPCQRAEHVPPSRRRRDASVDSGSGVVTGCFDSQAAEDRPVARDSTDRTRQGVGPGIFFGFNGRNTQTSGLPGLRPVAPSLRSGYGRPPHGGRWCAARTVTRATPGTCSVLDRRPRSATSKAQTVPLSLPDRPAAQPALRLPSLCQRDAKACPDGHDATPANSPGGRSARRHSRQGSSGRLHGRDHP